MQNSFRWTVRTDSNSLSSQRELRAALRPLQEKLETLNTAKQTCQETSEHIRVTNNKCKPSLIGYCGCLGACECFNRGRTLVPLGEREHKHGRIFTTDLFTTVVSYLITHWLNLYTFCTNLSKYKRQYFLKVSPSSAQRQAQNTVRLIKENFEKLHQFLQDEEISMLRALSEEEEQKSQKMKDKMDRLTDEIMTLREAISSSEEAMSADDVAFLKVGENIKKIFFF